VDDHNVKIALLESKLNDLIELPDRVLMLESDFRNMKTDISEIKVMQYRGAQDRQAQFEKLSNQIGEHHAKAMSKIQSVCVYQDERLEKTIVPISDDVKALYTMGRTIVFTGSILGAIITLSIALYAVLPK